ncbi:hypothetical protein FQN54_009548 [Arachnomyces sp. PD_36]|nr:hypothetical protein FQN54_009548 [Arachnomyces sp. PD_36]
MSTFQAVARSSVDYALIDKAFEGNSTLKKRVYDAISTTPQHATLFEDIAKYTSEQISRAQTTAPEGADGPASKKRKLDNGAAPSSDSKSSAGLTTAGPTLFYVQDMSFSMPQRKKFTVEMTGAEGGSSGQYIRARNQSTKDVEFGVPLGRIQHILCLPVPDKAQRQFNFCILPPYSDGITSPPEGDNDPALEPMVWTVSDGPAKNAYRGSGAPFIDDSNPDETYQALFKRLFNENLKHTKVICPEDKEFVSATPIVHRKNEKAYHVKAFRGSKEGYIFFLSTGIFFGFKKPLLFFSFENIDSISYTSVLQRTFDLSITTRSATHPDQEEQEFELSMIDQADYAGIDAYIKKHGLQDASLAEARRAKKLNINGVKGEDKGGDGDGVAGEGEDGEEESELQKAQRELEDQEDEEEEDYDPGSEGESEGSGSSSEEEDEGEGYDDEGGNLVEEELGSEAEEVSSEGEL